MPPRRFLEMPKIYKTLYLCYFGLREPLVQTQVLPYLRQIRDGGFRVSLLTFETKPQETWTQKEISDERERLADEGIEWHFLTYHKRPSAPATLYDVLAGANFIRKMLRKEDIDILHARVHVPALMGLIAKKLSRKKSKLLFDIRGFFPEEYTDAGRWKENGRLYKSVKRIEKVLLKESDGFVVLTERARSILFPESKETGFDKLGRPVEVIPCCVNLDLFNKTDGSTRAETRRKLAVENRFVLTYVGSFGGWYMTEEIADFLQSAKKSKPDTFAMILTQSKPEMIEPLLKERGFSEKDFLITKVLPTEIPRYLSAADAALSFIKPCYSKQASSPTKNAEYLALGLPIVVNSKIGDTAEMTREDKTGVVIEEFNQETYAAALTELDILLSEGEVLAERCKNSASQRFDLEKIGGVRYVRIYRKLLQK